MEGDVPFGRWLKWRRKQLDLTQTVLAQRVGCAAVTLRKIEAGRLRPSRQIAARLAECLQVPEAERAALIAAARLVERHSSAPASPDMPRPAHTHLSRLPASLTPLIGREAELAELGTLLADSGRRLITILGPGGIGKTRLALAAATQTQGRFADGAAFVPLAAISAAALVAPVILSVLGVALQGERAPREQLIEELRDKEMLLVLDNLEQLLAGAEDGETTTELLREIMQAAPDIRLLVTSRERLRTPGEWLFDLTGLRYLVDETGEGLAETAAMRLFVERARQVRSHLALTSAEVRVAARICRLVQGMPLAIELAAAALRGHSCATIADMLQERVLALAPAPRGVPERHRSIQAAFEHSWRLLSDKERAVFARLSVFRGGFEVEAAIDVAQADVSILMALFDKSLLCWDGTDRYDMHELLRQYAYEKLCQAQELERIQARHAAFFLTVSQDAASKLHGAGCSHWLERFEREHDNLRAALRWAVEHHSAELAAQLSVALREFWLARGHFSEGHDWFAQVLVLPRVDQIDVGTLSKALYSAGVLASYQSDYARAYALLGRSLAQFRALGDVEGAAWALNELGRGAIAQAEYQQARAWWDESLQLFRSRDDRRGMAMVLDNLGRLARERQDCTTAAALFHESLNLFRELGDRRGTAIAVKSLGNIALWHGDYGTARGLYEESLVLFRELGDQWGIAMLLNHLGMVARRERNYDVARALFEEGLQLRRKLKDRGGIAVLLYDLGLVAHEQGNHPQACVVLSESLELFQHVGRTHYVPLVLMRLASVWEAQGQRVEAVRLLGAVHHLLVTMDVRLHPDEQQEIECAIARNQGQSDPDDFGAVWAEGQAMTLDQALAYALQVSARQAPRSHAP